MPTEEMTLAQLEKTVATATFPILVDFYTETCPHCATVAAALEQVAQTPDLRARLVKVSLTKNPQAREKYGIRSVPTLLLFCDGVERERHIGAMPPAAIARMLALPQTV